MVSSVAFFLSPLAIITAPFHVMLLLLTSRYLSDLLTLSILLSISEPSYPSPLCDRFRCCRQVFLCRPLHSDTAPGPCSAFQLRFNVSRQSLAAEG